MRRPSAAGTPPPAPEPRIVDLPELDLPELMAHGNLIEDPSEPPGVVNWHPNNIHNDDLERDRKLAAELMSRDAKLTGSLVKADAWIELECAGDQA